MYNVRRMESFQTYWAKEMNNEQLKKITWTEW